ncbi:DUF6306 domain-containing protein [Mycetohabitans sp. B8]|uniref:DUF6306 domain-containing protein n=1 Tax=Mycetohabitans sp. B8 TaxID=2841845 RepID=UPI0034CD8C86
MRRLSALLPTIRDARLRSDLQAMLAAHQRNILCVDARAGRPRMARAGLCRSDLPRRSSAPGRRACAATMTVACIRHNTGIRALACQAGPAHRYQRVECGPSFLDTCNRVFGHGVERQ